jgi:transposase-like protein
VPAKSIDESTIRLLLAISQQESLTVYADGLWAYDLLIDSSIISNRTQLLLEYQMSE